MRFARWIFGLLSKSQAMLAAWEKPLCSAPDPLEIGSNISATFLAAGAGVLLPVII